MNPSSPAAIARRLLVVCTFACAVTASAADERPRTVSLFNGKDLAEFDKWLPRFGSQDPARVFTVVDNVDGQPAIRISGEHWGGLVTKAGYSNYRIIVEYRWGPATWGDRKNKARDSGVLLHCSGEFGNVSRNFDAPFIRSVEYQIIEGGTGDILLINGFDRGATKATGPAVTVRVAPGHTNVHRFWKPDGETATFSTGRINWQYRDPAWKDALGFRGPRDVEQPVGEWNRLEATTQRGDLRFYLNGVLVNEASNCSFTSGKIMIQSEGAELYVRRIELELLKD